MATPNFDIFAFLAEPRRAASVATTGRRGGPVLGMMWFHLEDQRLWFTSLDDGRYPFVAAARAGGDVAVLVTTPERPDDVRQVRLTGPARIEEPDTDRVRRIYARYVTEWTPQWEETVTSPSLRLWSMSPERGMALTYPHTAPPYRWRDAAELFGLTGEEV
jgi:hypothetical protein